MRKTRTPDQRKALNRNLSLAQLSRMAINLANIRNRLKHPIKNTRTVILFSNTICNINKLAEHLSQTLIEDWNELRKTQKRKCQRITLP